MLSATTVNATAHRRTSTPGGGRGRRRAGRVVAGCWPPAALSLGRPPPALRGVGADIVTIMSTGLDGIGPRRQVAGQRWCERPPRKTRVLSLVLLMKSRDGSTDVSAFTPPLPQPT